MIRGSTLDLQRAREPSRLFVTGNPDYLTIGVAAASGVPLSMAAWFIVPDVATDYSIMGIADNDTTADWFRLLVSGVQANDPLIADSYDGTDYDAAKTNGTLANVWHHGLATYSTNNTIYRDGGNVASVAHDATIANLDTTGVGICPTSGGFSFPATARIFWPCFWNVELTAVEAAVLGNRQNPTPPWKIRPDSIVGGPNLRTLWDPHMKALWTPTGTRPANPPWVWRPRQVSMFVPAVGTVAKHVIQAHRRAG